MMAKISFRDSAKYGMVLGYFETRFLQDDALVRVTRRGAAVIADAVRSAMEKLPTYVPGGKRVSSRGGLTAREKELLQKHFGLTPIKRDRDGFLHTKIGWDGYANNKTKKFPKGYPVIMIARTVESGSSWRKKIPFVRPVVKAKEKEAIDEMQRALDEELADIFNFEGRT